MNLLLTPVSFSTSVSNNNLLWKPSPLSVTVSSIELPLDKLFLNLTFLSLASLISCFCLLINGSSFSLNSKATFLAFHQSLLLIPKFTCVPLGKVVLVGAPKKDEPMEIQVGDSVFYGKYSGTELNIDGVDYLLMSQTDVLFIAE